MQKFHFSLEKILGWRRTELQAAEAGLAPLVAERRGLEAARHEIAMGRARADRDLLQGASVDGSELEALARYRLRIENQKSAIERDLADCRERTARQSALIIEAHRRLRLLEKLKARRLAEWHVQWEREMETFASEAFLARWKPP